MLIEVATFRLTDAAAEEEFLAADKAAQEEFFHHQIGFVRRTTARGADGSWVVITLWGSDADADAAAEAGAEDPIWADLHGLVDDASLDVGRYQTLD